MRLTGRITINQKRKEEKTFLRNEGGKKNTQLRTDAKISQKSKSQFKMLGACQKVICRKDAQISGTHLSTQFSHHTFVHLCGSK